MANFLEERLPKCIRISTMYDDEYAVEITSSGGTKDIKPTEYRRLAYPYPRRKFNVSYQLEHDDLLLKVSNIYHRCFGQFGGCRFYHLDDHSTAANGKSPPTAVDVILTKVSAKVFQLRKLYANEKTGLTIGWPERIIYKPIAGTTLIAVDGIATTAFTVDTKTGLVTLTATPAANAVITGGCEFDYPVRFNGPYQVMSSHPTSRSVEFELIELLNPLET